MDKNIPHDIIHDSLQPNDSEHSGQDEAVKILVVDHSRVVRTYLGSHLKKEGYAVALAKDGNEAMAMLSDDTGVVLVDLWMSEMDGMECLRCIRERHPDIPVIMMTVSHDIAHAVQAMKSGAFYYVTKPFNPDKISALVQQAITARRQAKRLHSAEGQPDSVHARESAIAEQIRQSLLLPHMPGELHGMKTGDLSVASKDIDGDFYDCFAVDNNCIDLIIGDVMGKGVSAALVGAEAKNRFMTVLYNSTRPSCTTPLPSPERIVSTVHKEMIRQLKEQETFFTLCYARFDMNRHLISYVDCGHMRTIHFHHATNACTLLQGVDMPIGFPGQVGFKEILAPFASGDLFFFYSDGITGAKNAQGEIYGIDRLVKFIQDNAHLESQELCDAAFKEITLYCNTRILPDDFTCVALKVDQRKDHETSLPRWNLTIKSDMDELGRLRDFIQEMCTSLGKSVVDGERIKMIQIVATEITTNIIKHAYAGKKGSKIVIEAAPCVDEIVLNFYDWGSEFDFSNAPSPVFDGSREDGFGLHIIAHTADYVRYWRDEDGRNGACVTFFLNKRG